ncbi:FadR family transcriptional regulator [Pseudonocardia sp. C8]|uniref:FadR/GntR family transcriptional regulator n=1 Tax=Pseudonocardia sp. C8 TaxID=2762759 RepID=UPI00164265D6|nr:FadR family transcriptional regulator [Pseudonocardia sp. C8]
MTDVPQPDATGWQRVRRARAHELVIEQIEAQIRRGGLQRGDRLPGERQLSGLLGVSRASVREALRSLEALGILAERTTAGPESGPVLASGPSDALSSMLRLHIGLSNFTEVEVVQTRLMVEEWAVRDAAVRITPDDIAELSAVLDRMDRPGIDIVQFNALDSAFHNGIALACQNRLIGHLTGALRDAVERHRLVAMRSFGPWKQVSVQLQTQHRDILDCIASRQPDAAAEALRHHLEHTYPGIVGGRPGRSSP